MRRALGSRHGTPHHQFGKFRLCRLGRRAFRHDLAAAQHHHPV
jgi:hypothetical protein